MFREILWALILGFCLSAVVQAVVSKREMRRLLPDDSPRLFLTDNETLAKLWGPIVGPVVAIISFVCSIGNVPLAAVLWNGGISSGGVIAFSSGEWSRWGEAVRDASGPAPSTVAGGDLLGTPARIERRAECG